MTDTTERDIMAEEFNALPKVTHIAVIQLTDRVDETTNGAGNGDHDGASSLTFTSYEDAHRYVMHCVTTMLDVGEQTVVIETFDTPGFDHGLSKFYVVGAADVQGFIIRV